MVIGKGDRRSQQQRRRKNNKGIPIQKEEYLLIDGNYSNRPIAYCCHYKAYLTNNQIMCHDCKNRNCSQLKSFEYKSTDKENKDD